MDSMTTLNREASRAAVEAGISAATDVTGFGLLGHLYKMMRASGIAAELDASAVPAVEGAKEALLLRALFQAAPAATWIGYARTSTMPRSLAKKSSSS